MARLQILELPEGSGDDRPPFVLVIDQAPHDENSTAFRDDLVNNEIATRTGARHVLVFEDTIEIPGNDVPLDPDGYPVKMRIEPDFETFRKQVQDEIRKTQGELRDAINRDSIAEPSGPECQYCGADCSDGRSWDGGDLYACPRCAEWRARLNQHQVIITDALGMDRTRDWGDIRNAAAGLRKERDAQAAELERLRAGEEPVTDSRIVPTPGQWMWQWNRATPEKRQAMATQILDGMTRSSNCFMADHEAQIASLRVEVERLRTGQAATSRDITVDNAADVVASHDPTRRA